MPQRLFFPILTAVTILMTVGASAQAPAGRPPTTAKAHAMPRPAPLLPPTAVQTAPVPAQPHSHKLRNALIVVAAAVGTALVLFFTLRTPHRGCDHCVESTP